MPSIPEWANYWFASRTHRTRMDCYVAWFYHRIRWPHRDSRRRWRSRRTMSDIWNPEWRVWPKICRRGRGKQSLPIIWVDIERRWLLWDITPVYNWHQGHMKSGHLVTTSYHGKRFRWKKILHSVYVFLCIRLIGLKMPAIGNEEREEIVARGGDCEPWNLRGTVDAFSIYYIRANSSDLHYKGIGSSI